MARFKFVKVNGSMLWGEQELTREMLHMVKNHQYDTIINLEDLTYFDADENAWKEIDGTRPKD